MESNEEHLKTPVYVLTSSAMHPCGQISCSHENLSAWMHEMSAISMSIASCRRNQVSCEAAGSHEVAILRMARLNGTYRCVFS